MFENQVRHPVRQRPRFPRTRPRHHQQRPAEMLDGLALGGVELAEKVSGGTHGGLMGAIATQII